MTNAIMPTSIGDLFSFRGTLERIPYVARQVVTMVLIIGTSLMVVSSMMHDLETGSGSGNAVYTLAGCVVLIGAILISLANITKRVRDIGWPTWTVAAFLLGTTGLGILGTDNDMPGLVIATNIATTIAGLSIVFMPSKKSNDFPAAIYARKPQSITDIDQMLVNIPDEGSNAFLTFIFADDTAANFGPDNVGQMKKGWDNIRSAMTNGVDTKLTLLRRDASEAVVNGENVTDDRMWIIDNQKAWELTPDEIKRAMA